MDLKFAGRTAVVTGASQGIGRATALMLADALATVVGVARRVALIEELAATVRGAGRIVALDGDFYDPETPARVAAEAERRLGHVDILREIAALAVSLASPLANYRDGDPRRRRLQPFRFLRGR